MKEQIQTLLSAECPWRDTLHWHTTTDSTNTQAKLLAQQGAPHGTVVAAGCQTQGRGRLGRSFHSPAGAGIYLSVILRPNCKPEQLMHLTCVAAVAASDAVAQAAGIMPQTKWINDLVLDGKKLGGILTELSCDPATGLVRYAIVGIGINCNQRTEDFPPQLQQIATSLFMACNRKISPAAVAAALIENLAQAADTFIAQKAHWMQRYRSSCSTLGKEVRVIQNDLVRPGRALELDENGALLVAFSDGSTQWVQTGEVSVRGMFGYV